MPEDASGHERQPSAGLVQGTLMPEASHQLEGLGAARDVLAGEAPVQDGHGACRARGKGFGSNSPVTG